MLSVLASLDMFALNANGPGRAPESATPRKVEVTNSRDPFPVHIAVHADRPIGPLPPVWRFFGADEPNYATMRNGAKLIAELGRLKPGEVFFRTHNLLCTGDGTPALKWGSTNAYTEDAQGRPVYDWRILDRIFDTYIANRVRPYVEIGFMPKALSISPEPYQHHWTPTANYNEIYTGWSYPPKDYTKWADVVYRWAKHCVDRYGRREVEKWYWETWNEPNIGYWRGTPADYRKLHDYAADAVRRAIPKAKIGGADTAGYGGRFTRDFIEHCLRGTNAATGKIGTPLDFVSFHAKGAPEFVDGHVRMGIANQLREFDNGFRLVASFPELAGTPIIVGESDPDGCAACQGPQLGYRNGTMYSSYTAASIARELELMDKHRVNFEGSLTWAFTFENQPLFAGFRQLASGGIDLPVLNTFRMLSMMKGERISVESSSMVPLDTIQKSGVRGDPDVGALASLDHGRVAVLAWHYHDDDVAGPEADVTLDLTGIVHSGRVRVRRYVIDEEHSNSYTAWKKMGSPPTPSAAEYQELERAGQLAEWGPASSLDVRDDRCQLRIRLPRKAVALLVFEAA